MQTIDEQRTDRQTAVIAGTVTGIAVTLAIVALVAQNTKSVTVRWLFLDGQQPLWAILAMTAFAGALVAKLAGAAWHHRRNH
jgi:uncharacterized integral membrane protein